MTKQLAIVYDKKYEYHANLLYNLLSQHPDIKSSFYTKKEIKKLVSREKCLYIGKDCSSNLRFDDCFNELGVHIGHMGAKAWIRCFKYEWNANKINEFENMLKLFSDKYNLKKEYNCYECDKERINQDFQIGLEPWPGNAIKRMRDKDIMNNGTTSRVRDICFSVYNQLLLGGYYIKLNNMILGDEPTIRWYQYLLGVLKFYEDYLNDFLELSDSNKESNEEDTITENEKKN